MLLLFLLIRGVLLGLWNVSGQESYACAWPCDECATNVCTLCSRGVGVNAPGAAWNDSLCLSCNRSAATACHSGIGGAGSAGAGWSWYTSRDCTQANQGPTQAECPGLLTCPNQCVACSPTVYDVCLQCLPGYFLYTLPGVGNMPARVYCALCANGGLHYGQCDQGLDAHYPDGRVCSGNEQIDTQTCAPVVCPALQVSSHQFAGSCVNRTVVGQRCTSDCQLGFTLDPESSASLQCVRDWSTSAPPVGVYQGHQQCIPAHARSSDTDHLTQLALAVSVAGALGVVVVICVLRIRAERRRQQRLRGGAPDLSVDTRPASSSVSELALQSVSPSAGGGGRGGGGGGSAVPPLHKPPPPAYPRPYHLQPHAEQKRFLLGPDTVASDDAASEAFLPEVQSGDATLLNVAPLHHPDPPQPEGSEEIPLG